MQGNKNKIIAFNYFGGKFTWLDQIYPYFPSHKHFIDLMCGSMSVILNKQPSCLDTANDIDGSVVNFFKVLRENPNELCLQLALTPVSRKEYRDCYPIYEQGISEIEHARRFFVRCRQSFQGSGIKEHTGFNACIQSSSRGLSKNVSDYISSIEKLPQVINRLRHIQIEQKSYKDILSQYDRNDTFFFIDPPYELRKRNYKKWYNSEFHDIDHIELAGLVHQIQGKAMICGYDSSMYQELYKDWTFVKLKPKGHSMKKGKLQEECIWMNY